MVWRLFECALALAFLCLTLPVIAAAALAILSAGDGPVLFRQTRIGKGGRRFRILKLRSMTGRGRRARVTAVGRVLRSLHIDELPQLINVLRGEMALVGPRPEIPLGVTRLAGAIPGYRARLAVRPGLTGLAQIRQPHGTSLASERIKAGWDHDYLRRRSALTDLSILAQTPAVVLFGHRVRPAGDRRPSVSPG